MWYMFFIVGGFWFWTLAAIELLLLTWFVEEEWGSKAFFSVVIFTGLITLFGDATVLTHVKNNPLDILRWAAIYFGAGVGWSLVKFYFQTSKLRRKVDNLKIKFREANLSREHEYTTEIETKLWKKYIRDYLSYEDNKNLEFSSYTARLLFWMTYWPVSLVWTMLNDPIKRFFKWCYEAVLIGVYKKIFEHTLGSAKEL